jgi:hypothetical protein
MYALYLSTRDTSYHRVVTSAFWRTFSHEGKIRPGWWGWGEHAHPLSLHLPSPVKLQCTLQLSGQMHNPCFISSKNMYSVPVTNSLKERHLADRRIWHFTTVSASPHFIDKECELRTFSREDVELQNYNDKEFRKKQAFYFLIPSS